MTINAPLSAEAIQQYQEEGYLIPDCQLPESRLTELMEAVERVLVTNPEVRPEKLVSVHISGLNQEGVRGDDAFMELAKDPMIVDCVEQLIGPDIINLHARGARLCVHVYLVFRLWDAQDFWPRDGHNERDDHPERDRRAHLSRHSAHLERRRAGQ